MNNFLNERIAVITAHTEYPLSLYDDIITTDDEYDETIIRHLTEMLDFNLQVEGAYENVVQIDKLLISSYKHTKRL